MELGDYGFISDCHGAALVSRAGSVDWCCLPRFDSGSCFGRLLDTDRGGHFALTAPGAETELRYLGETMVLETIVRADGGEARVLDFFALGGRRRLVRIAEGVSGEVRFEVELAPRFDYGDVRPWVRRDGDGVFRLVGGSDALQVASEATLEPRGEHALRGELTVAAGERVRIALTYFDPRELDEPAVAPDARELDAQLDETAGWWRGWARRLEGPGQDPAVQRSALTLRGLVYEPTSAIVAAATTSLPESPEGTRTWDYRFCWVRDATLAVRALGELGAAAECEAFPRFVLRTAAGHADDLQVAYGVGGERRIGETELDLAGWRGARPVRAGNDAVTQDQHDELGEILNLVWRWHERGHVPDDDEWGFVVSVVDRAARRWRDPDQGFWEWRGGGRHFVYSKAACFAALDRGLALAEALGREAPAERWAAERDAARDVVLGEGFDEATQTFLQVIGEPQLDATALLLPLTGVVGWDDERMRTTADAVAERLDDDGLLRRYEGDDGLPGREGAFLACAFWLVECLARQGRVAEAGERYERALRTATPLGLFTEEYDTRAGRPLGNLPQALTHLSHIAAAIALTRG